MCLEHGDNRGDLRNWVFPKLSTLIGQLATVHISDWLTKVIWIYEPCMLQSLETILKAKNMVNCYIESETLLSVEWIIFWSRKLKYRQCRQSTDLWYTNIHNQAGKWMMYLCRLVRPPLLSLLEICSFQHKRTCCSLDLLLLTSWKFAVAWNWRRRMNF